MTSGEQDRIEEAASFIRSKTNFLPKIGITLGSGLSSFAEQVNEKVEFSFSEIPHFLPPTVDGHPGKLVLGTIGRSTVAVFQGRIHFYEGHSPSEVVFPTRVLNAIGVETLILTNAAGGLNPKMSPGDFMVITDHINLMGYNPLLGPNLNSLGPRFPDMTNVYHSDLRMRLCKLLKEENIPYHEGVYVGLTGPSYETPAEIRFLSGIGGSAVGMSTVPEAIAARHMGMDILGISCITNLGSGISTTPLSHNEVTETGKRVEKIFGRFLRKFVENF
ncbi:MAG: purine-nucleoside phosphorylase [Bdellovibrionales bacterium]|nr:purine-nucleoside phosphorylase [Bdellovibrionales bacterium]